ncbi:MAG: hypothetical protein J5730_04665 [Bacteroidales bacterium]|nr:hypothetical protein [Bacteroidales bacterium]
MKPYKILIFILLIICALGAISLFFPKDGLRIGKKELHFPTMEQVLTGPEESKVELKEEVDSVALKQLNDLKDTLHQYQVALTEQTGHFYLPNDDVSFFDRLFAKMEQARRNHEVVRVLHYGDSQIEMDRISCNLRSYFQSTFGGGGPGLVPVIQTIPSFAVSQSASGALTLYASYGEGARTRGNYGLMCKCYHLAGGATFTAYASRHKDTDPRVKRFSNVTLLYNDRDGHFRATLRDRMGTFKDTCENGLSGVHTCHWLLDSATTSLQINMQGNADIYGIMLDDGYGVAVDNIPLRGSSGDQFTLITDTLLRTSYKQANVGLIILQFGGNSVPVIYNDKSLNNYCNSIDRQIKRIKSCYPAATLLFIGPSDMSTRRGGVMQTYPMLPRLIDSLRAVALRNNAAYWDIYEVMGGQNSMLAWVRNGLAGPDYIHFTPAGARRVGKTLAQNFATMYEFYRTRKKIPQNQFDTLWNTSAK